MRLDPEQTGWLQRPGIDRLLTALDAAQGGARFVGGAVRDTLLGLEVGDLDLATPFPPTDVTQRLERARIKVVPTGIDHGTITAVASGTVVEVTSLRADVSTDGRRATVAFTDDWQADAARRDFTINALYADPLSGEIYDYFGGLADLAARTVRFIGDPLQRIAEDHLRILRFFRFHARFGSGAPDPEALDACTARANDLMALSRERIADELAKLLALPDPTPTVRLMEERAIFRPVLPEITRAGVETLERLVEAEHQADIAPDPWRHLAALLPADPAQAERIAARLKLSNKAKKRLGHAAGRTIGMAPRALAYRLGTQAAIDRLLLADRAGDAAAIAAWTPPRLPVGGGDLVARGIAKGPEVARRLKAIEDRWVAEDFPLADRLDAIVAEVLAAPAVR